MGKPTVFISYSHKDEIWKDRLLPMVERMGYHRRDREVEEIARALG